MARIQAHGPLTGRIGDDAIEVDGATVAEVVGNVDARYPGFKADVMRADGSCRSSVVFSIGERIVAPAHPVSAGDLIDVDTEVAGG